MQDFRQLQVWQRAYQFTLEIYRVSKVFPSEEKYGLTSQLRRATVSIAANIAEGCGRGSNADLARFLRIAMGSASEVECFIMLARDLGFISEEDSAILEGELCEVKRMLNTFTQRVQPKAD